MPERQAASRSSDGEQSITAPVGPLLVAVFLAVCFWGWVFGTSWGNFWWKITTATALLAGFALWVKRPDWREDFFFSLRHIRHGVLSAVFLYAFFWFGGESLRYLVPSSGEMINAVYVTRAALPGWAICLLLLFIIAPAEEIFWRGLVQKHLARLTGPRFGLIVGALVYALVHLWAKNGVLLLAAFICGLTWGWQYYKSNSLVGPIISHIIWDLTIFIFAPLD